MKNLRIIARIFILLTKLLPLVACLDNEGDRIFDEIVGRWSEDDAVDA